MNEPEPFSPRLEVIPAGANDYCRSRGICEIVGEALLLAWRARLVLRSRETVRMTLVL
jgi:hypothetical protein